MQESFPINPIARLDSFWLQTTSLIIGPKTKKLKENGIVIIGSGISGVSSAYWLIKNGYSAKDITIIDYKTYESASFRNAGHILYGSVESAQALKSIKGEIFAKEIIDFSVEACTDLKETVRSNNLQCEYRQNGYLVIALDKNEEDEIKESVEVLNGWNIKNKFLNKESVKNLGFKNTFGARFEQGSARAHPVKFRNEILKYCLKKGIKYFSDIKVKNISGTTSKATISTNIGDYSFDAAIIATNAFSPLVSNYYKEHNLLEPFKGQIIVSNKINEKIQVQCAHSFNHGYEYSLFTEDNRLLIGGWRNEVGGETGSYDMSINPKTEKGLKQFVKKHYNLKNELKWEYSWSGLMAASNTGLPFVGPTNTASIYSCTGFTGHGFSWAHGCAKNLSQMILGIKYNETVKKFSTPN